MGGESRSASKESRRSSRRSSKRISIVFLIRITVLDEAGEEKCCVVLQPRNKVWELHRKLAELLGVPPLRQKLMHREVELAAPHLLQDALADPEGHEVDAAAVTLLIDESSTFVLTGAVDRVAILWSADTGQAIHQFKGHLNSINSVVFSREGSLLLTASDDHTARLWSTLSAEHLGTYKGHKWAVNSAIFEPEEINKKEKKKKEVTLKPKERKKCDTILTASQDGSIKIFHMKKETCLKTFKGHTGPVNSAVFSSDAAVILSASHDSTAKLWSVEREECTQTFVGHRDIVFGAVYSADCTTVLTSSCDRTARLWSAETGECLKIFQNHRGCVLAAVFSLDEASVLTVCEDHVTCRIHNIETGECSVPFKGDGSFAQSAHYGHDGRSVLLGYNNRTAQIWNLERGERVQTLRGHGGSLVSAVFSPFQVEVEVTEEPIFREGKVIEALFADEGPYQRAVVLQVNGDSDSVTVEWEHRTVPAADARLVLESEPDEDEPAADAGEAGEGEEEGEDEGPEGFEEGMVVEAKFFSQKEAYHKAAIVTVNDDDTLTLSWEYNTVHISNCRKALNIGHPVTDRHDLDSETDVQFVDTGVSFPDAGRVTGIKFFVAQANQAGFKFQVWRSIPSKKNKYDKVGETPVIECPNAGTHLVYALESPIEMQAGDFMGWCHDGKGTISFSRGGGDVRWRDGVEEDWENIEFDKKQPRTYSYEVRYEKLQEDSDEAEEEGAAGPALTADGSAAQPTADATALSTEGVILEDDTAHGHGSEPPA